MWSEWEAFKIRWGFHLVVTTDENADARFEDGSVINMESRELSVGDLKPGEIGNLPRTSRLPVEWPTDSDGRPLGLVEHLHGADGIIRGYVRVEDHERLMANAMEIAASA